MRKVIAITGALVLILAAASTSQAVLLSELVKGGEITSGDKLFNNWSVLYYDASDGRTFNAANIDVQAIGSVPNPGISFSVSNNELLVTGDDLYAYVDLTLSFQVTALDATMMIKDASLDLINGMLSWVVDQLNDSGMYISEKIGTAQGLDDLGSISTQFDLSDDVINRELTASVNFTPQSSIWVTKNILVWAVDATDAAVLWDFDQHFSQGPVGVPEPGMLALLALGGLALLRFTRN
jgi:PEP-CTERM motif